MSIERKRETKSFSNFISRDNLNNNESLYYGKEEKKWINKTQAYFALLYEPIANDICLHKVVQV